MQGWALIEELRGRVGLERGVRAGAEDVERLLDVVPGLSLEEGHPLLVEPYLYTCGDGRGIIRTPPGWSKRIGNHDFLLEEVLHHCLGGYADYSATTHGQRRGHAREETRIGDHQLMWWFAHGPAANFDDEELAADTGRSLADVARFRELQLRG